MAFQASKAAWRRAVRVGAATIAVAAIASCGGGGGGSNEGGDGPMNIQTVNNRADLVSGGDALVVVTAPPGLLSQSFKVTVNGRDVTSAFIRTSNRTMSGVVTGLAEGQNAVVATTGSTPKGVGQGSSISERLVITNHPRSGPVYSGPAHITPFYCATPTPVPGSGNTPTTLASGLSGQPDAACNIATETRLYYRTNLPVGNGTTQVGTCTTALPDPNTPPAVATTYCFKPYTPGTTPADMAAPVTTDNGQTVPYIVRLERGTMNRGIYDLAVLFDPAKPWSATAPQAQWNGKVYYHFGASTGQPRRQSRTTSSAWSSLEEQLKRGWIVVSNSMSDSVRNSNRVLMSETVMMMKEHIGDSYGPIRFTLGTGCSGGSINSNMTLSIFPGLLDGVITSCTYPDSETTTMEVGDCVLLSEAYQKPQMTTVWAGLALDPAAINARKAAINGHPDQTACHAWYNLFGSNGRPGVYKQRTVTDHVMGTITESATAINNCELPNTAVYDPANAAATANLPRCNAWGWATNIWGTIPGTSTPRDTRDNVGVQYGLRALLSGAITAEEFVTLNEVIGGTDKDSEFTASRSVADAEALDIAYRSGIVASGRNLAKAPMIDLRGWDDSLIDLPPNSFGMTGIHHIWFSFAVRDRIARDYGDADNQVMWRWARGNFSIAPGTLGLEALNTMDQWLTSLVTTPGNTAIEAKVRATKPAGMQDFCILSTDATQSARVTDMAQCDADKYLKPSLSPRQVAGGPRSENILKCQLKPLNAADYGSVSFTTLQWDRLNAVFPGGVCDWSKPGVGQQAAVSPLNFRAAPGSGVPLGAAPVSERVR